jgi:DNA-binding CsgD family transcriptional regulator
MRGEVVGRSDESRSLLAMAFMADTPWVRDGASGYFSDDGLLWDQLNELCGALYRQLHDATSSAEPCAVRRTRWGEFEFRGYRVSGGAATHVSAAVVLQHLVPESIALLRHVRGADLSIRQKELCWLMLRGFSGGQIATEMGISLATVKEYQRAVYSKLGVDTKEALLTSLKAREPA